MQIKTKPMEDMFAQRKWYNIIESIIERYNSNVIDADTIEAANKLLSVAHTLNPQRLPELFKLHLTKTKMSFDDQMHIIDQLLESLTNPLEKTSDHEKVVLFFEILKTNFMMDRKDVQHEVYHFKGMSIFTNMDKKDVVKRELNELLLKYFEKTENFNKAAFYAKELGDYQKYVKYTLFSDELNRIEGEIEYTEHKKEYERMINGDFEYFTDPEKYILRKKAMTYYILRKCYMADQIDISELAKEMGIEFILVLRLVINLLTSEKIKGFVDKNTLVIHGTVGVSDLNNLKLQYEEWIARIRMVKKELQ